MPEKNIFLKEMGQRIANRRREMNLTQEELAEKADVTSQMLSNAERGTKALRPENLLKICLALNESVDFIMTGDETVKRKSNFSLEIEKLTYEQNRLISEIIQKCVELSNIK